MTSFAIWITGLPAAGKSTVANAVVRELAARGQDVVVLESDALRRIYTPEPTFSPDERRTFYETVERLAGFLVERGVPVVVDATAHRREWRERARTRIPRLIEVYVDTPISVCRARDPKGLYELAAHGGTVALPGVQVPYEPPASPDVVVLGEREAPADAARRIVARLVDLRYLA